MMELMSSKSAKQKRFWIISPAGQFSSFSLFIPPSENLEKHLTALMSASQPGGALTLTASPTAAQWASSSRGAPKGNHVRSLPPHPCADPLLPAERNQSARRGRSRRATVTRADS